MSFAELPEDQRQQLLDYQFSVHTFPPDTDDRMILQIFARMNSTGYSLLAQELRNAEFSRAFKTLVYGAATEQLDRWRDWGIFSPDKIARMAEVELASEFFMLISHGQMGKRQNLITAFYRKYDDAFPDSAESIRRFRITFDEMEKRFGKVTIKALFQKRSLFYALFATIYGLQFGLQMPIPLEEPDKEKLGKVAAKPISAATLAHILTAGETIKAKVNVPPEVAKALRGASSDVSQRRRIIGFLAGPDDPCPQLP
jgi:hypothetical protein